MNEFERLDKAISKIINWFKGLFKRKTAGELKDEIFPGRKLMAHEEPIEGVDPVKVAAARKYAAMKKAQQYHQMKKTGYSTINDRTIRRDIEKLYGIKLEAPTK